MKRRTLIVAAMLAAMTIGANAQENLALGKTVTTSSNQETSQNLVDENYGTGWEVNTAIEHATDLATGYWFYIDLGSKQKFNTLKIRWENASSHKFDVYTADDLGTDGTPNFGEEPACSIDQEITNIAETQTYNLGDLEARYVKIKARVLDYNGDYWHLFEVGVYNTNYTKVLTDVEVPTYVELGSEFTINTKDQYGNSMTAQSIEATNATKVEGSDNTFVAGESGKIEVTVKDSDVEKNVTIWVVPQLTKPTLKETDYSFFDDSVDALDMYGTTWEGGYGAVSTIDFTGNKALEATTVKTFGFKEKDETNIGTEYQSFNFDIYPTEDVTDGYINFEGPGKNVSLPTLKAGEWNHVSIDVTSLGDNFKNYIKWKLRDQNGAASTLNILLDNVYFSKDEAQLTEGVKVSTVSDEKGFYAVTGYSNSAETINEQLKDESVTAYDFSNFKFGDGVTSIDVANKNAMIQVAGTVENDVATIADNAKAIENTPNLVVESGGYYFPISKLHLTDGYTPYTASFISTHETGYEYTRKVTAGKWITITSPANIYDLPEGLLVYEATESTEANTIAFNKVTTIAAHTPYIAYAKNDLTLTANGTGDLDMEVSKQQSKSLGNGLTLNSTYAGVTGSEGKYYGIYAGATDRDENTLKLQRLGATAKLGAFRAYISVPTSQNISEFKVLINDGIETAIYNIQTTDNMKSANGVYSADGRLVRLGNSTTGLEKGVYVVNGKKVVVK